MSTISKTEGLKLNKLDKMHDSLLVESQLRLIPKRLNLFYLNTKSIDAITAKLRECHYSHINIADDGYEIFSYFWNTGGVKFRKNMKYLTKTKIIAHNFAYQNVYRLRNTRNLQILAYPDSFDHIFSNLRSKPLKNLFIHSIGSRNITYLSLGGLKRKIPKGLFVELIIDDETFTMQKQNWFSSRTLSKIENVSFSLLQNMGVFKNGSHITGSDLNKIVNLREIITGNIVDSFFEMLVNGFNNWNSLVVLDLFLNFHRISFLEAAAQNCKSIRNLKLTFISNDLETLSNEIRCVESLQCIQNFAEITDFTLIFPLIQEKLGDHLSLKFLMNLQKISRLTLLAQNQKTKLFFNLKDIALILDNLPNLEFFSLAGTFKIEEFNDFLSRTRDSNLKLTELKLDLNFDKKIQLSKAFKYWLQFRPELKYITLSIGNQTDSPNVMQDSIEHIFEGILSLQHPYRLSLAIGHEDYYWSSFSEINNRHLVSDFIKRLNKTKVLKLRMGTGYTNEDEIRRIMSALMISPCIKEFIIGEIFQNIPNQVKKDVIAFLSSTETYSKFKSAMIGPPDQCISQEKLIHELTISLTPRMWKGNAPVTQSPDFRI